MSYVNIERLSKRFSENTIAVNNVSFEVEKGKFVTLLGPSGCGKTTTLRCIAGLEHPEEGEIYIDGQCMYSAGHGIMVQPENRDLGMVFQSYAIWPHMSVGANVSYGLKMKGVPKAERKRKVEEALELVGLAGMADRDATKVSGGQQQRVALARALVFSPKLLLFDEPLSNLDAKLRERMRLDLTNLVHEVGFTSIYVTHDQAEAMVMSDRIIVMNEGTIQQEGTAFDIYNTPANRFVANFIGIANLLDGYIVEKSEETKICGVEIFDGIKSNKLLCNMSAACELGEKVCVSIRPEDINIFRERSEINENNELQGRVMSAIYMGNFFDCRVFVGNIELRIQSSHHSSFKKNDTVYLGFSPPNCLCIKI